MRKRKKNILMAQPRVKWSSFWGTTGSTTSWVQHEGITSLRAGEDTKEEVHGGGGFSVQHNGRNNDER